MQDIFSSRDKGSVIASINLLLAALLILAAAGWSFIQKGCHAYYQREASAFFEKIEKNQVRYKNINNTYLSFAFNDSSKALRKLNVDPRQAKYYRFSVEVPDRTTFRVIASLKPEILRKWYLHNPNMKLQLVYEKKEAQKGRILSQ